ncbi:MAG TPA: hypothetical protein ACQGQX_03315, partial [Xylella taiwanensis]
SISLTCSAVALGCVGLNWVPEFPQIWTADAATNLSSYIIHPFVSAQQHVFALDPVGGVLAGFISLDMVDGQPFSRTAYG